MSRSSVLKTLFSDFESQSFSHRKSKKTREDLWATYARAKKKKQFWEADEKNEKGGGHFQIEVWLKKIGLAQKTCSRSHLGDRLVRN